MARVTVGGTFTGLLDRARRSVEDLRGRPRMRTVVFNPVPYYDYVENGTTRMKPVGMVKKSRPLIDAFLADQLSGLGPFPTNAELDRISGRTEDFALDTIRLRTPIRKLRPGQAMPENPEERPGRLRRGFKVKVVRY